jgi:hypothetical protein
LTARTAALAAALSLVAASVVVVLKFVRNEAAVVWLLLVSVRESGRDDAAREGASEAVAAASAVLSPSWLMS